MENIHINFMLPFMVANLLRISTPRRHSYTHVSPSALNSIDEGPQREIGLGDEKTAYFVNKQQYRLN